MIGIPKCMNGMCGYSKSEEIDGCSSPLKSMDSCDDSIVVKVKQVVEEECACGEEKATWAKFCWRCYKELPSELKSRLYNKFDPSYEEAHQYLVDNGRIE